MIDQIAVVDPTLNKLPNSEQVTNPQDVIDFRTEMESDSPEIQLIENNFVDPRNEITINQTEGIGDTIVKKLESLRVESKQQLHEINNVLDRAVNNGVDAKSLLEMQVKLFQFTYQTQITTKVSDKANEGIKTLFRQQG